MKEIEDIPQKGKIPIFIYDYYYYFVVLGFEFRASHLLGRISTT
jgi:hypothetical protein